MVFFIVFCVMFSGVRVGKVLLNVFILMMYLVGDLFLLWNSFRVYYSGRRIL